MEMVCHTMNRIYSDSEDCKGVPYTLLYGNVPDVSYLRQPGCIALVHKMDKDRRKLDEKARLCLLIGYNTEARAYTFLEPETGRKLHSIHARFYERRRDVSEYSELDGYLLEPPLYRHNKKVSS